MSNLPVKTTEDFIAECETMDLSALKEGSFLVAISQGDRNKPKFVSSSVRGPYNFTEMCEQVGMMWRDHQHHAKVTILEKDPEKPAAFLDENTSDYIECHWETIVTESVLDDLFQEDKEFTCRAGLTTDTEDDVRFKEKEEAPKEEDEL